MLSAAIVLFYHNRVSFATGYSIQRNLYNLSILCYPLYKFRYCIFAFKIGGHNTYFSFFPHFAIFFLRSILRRDSGLSILDYMLRRFRNNNSYYSYHEWILTFSPALSIKLVLCPPILDLQAPAFVGLCAKAQKFCF